MTRAELMAYQAELARVAATLGLSTRGKVENDIIEHFKAQIRKWITAYGKPATLNELLDLVASTLKLEVVEVHDDEDLRALLERIPPSRDPAMTRLATELSDDTDGITVRRMRPESWEQPYLAVINCRERHFHRRFFSKWHEVAHRLVEGEEMVLAYRRTPATDVHRDPAEILVDRVAAAIAFHPDLFEPVFLDELDRAGRLTFAAIGETRTRIAPDASLEATERACFRHYSEPACFVRCHMGYKSGEERQLERAKDSFWPEMLSPPPPKLRVAESFGSPAANRLGIRFHQRMQVPELSIVAEAFNDSLPLVRTGVERLETWTTSSSGPIGWGELHVEAMKIEDEVWAILHLYLDTGTHRN
jgi:hypothetical protein